MCVDPRHFRTLSWTQRRRRWALEAAALALMDRLVRWFKRRGFSVRACPREPEGWIVAKRGEAEARPYLVAHLDTVWSVPDSREPERKVALTPNGVWIGLDGCGSGADDRAGVITIIEALARIDGPVGVVLTMGEETGLEGARHVPAELLGDAAYFVQIDRRGTRDLVYYDVGTDAFRETIQAILGPYGFTEAQGTVSDIVALCPKAGVAGCNVSNGSWHEHTHRETLLDAHLDFLACLLPGLLRELGSRRFPLPPKPTDNWGW